MSDTNLLTPEAVSDPYTVLHRLRPQGPIVWSPEHRAWLVVSHDEVLAGFKDHERLSSERLDSLRRTWSPERRAAMATTFRILEGWMVFHDEPAHARLRAPVRRAFTPRRVEQLRDEVAGLVTDLLDDVSVRLSDGEVVDLRAEFAFPLPATVIALLLGVPVSDRDRFKTWSHELSGIVFSTGFADKDATAERASEAFAEYFGWLVDRYRRDPEDNLISALVAAADAEGLSADELVGACTLLLFGGHETTTNLIANGIVSLARFPGERARLAADPTLLADGVEELLRHEGAAKVMVRSVAVPHERAGVAMEANQVVYLLISGANHDPALYDAPDDVRIDRRPTQHVAFGYGSHFCLGASLARLEGQLAIGALLDRFPSYELAGEVAFEPTIISRTSLAVPVRLG